jgi:hypothetical protein
LRTHFSTTRHNLSTPWKNRKDLKEVSTETEHNPAKWPRIITDILQRTIDSLECILMLHWCLVPGYQSLLQLGNRQINSALRRRRRLTTKIRMSQWTLFLDILNRRNSLMHQHRHPLRLHPHVTENRSDFHRAIFGT